MKNVTLSIPDDLLRKSREYAKMHGTSLNELIRTLLRRQVSPPDAGPVQRFIHHTERVKITTQGWKWNRDDIYDREILS